MNPVLISGAGVSGLLLARSLRTNGIPFLLYERDVSINARAQGYRIRISKDGLDALKEVLPKDQLEKFFTGTANIGGTDMQHLDAISGEEQSGGSEDSGTKSRTSLRPTGGGDVFGVARAWLRQCLFEGMSDVVHWNKQTTGYSISSTEVVLNFADGSSSPAGSLLVAADGPHSTIVRQLTHGKVRAYDTGTRMIHGQTPAKLFRQLGEGVWAAKDKTKSGTTLGFITNVRPGSMDDDIELGWVLGGSPGSVRAPGDNFSVVGKVAADLSRELTASWHEKLRVIFEGQNDAEAAFLKMSTADPKGIPEWENSPRVTMMGDSVHCMTPAGGVGANTALRDAAFLGRLLKEAGGWKEGITKEYDTTMREYASANVTMSFQRASAQYNITELK